MRSTRETTDTAAPVLGGVPEPLSLLVPAKPRPRVPEQALPWAGIVMEKLLKAL